MKFLKFLIAETLLSTGAFAQKTDSFTYHRLDKTDAALLIVDHQEGLYQLVRDFDPFRFRTNVIGHSALGKAFNLPVVMTTSTENGPNGLLIAEARDMHPDAPLIRRPGQVNAWDNEDFREAVRATNKSQIIIGGIATDVCTEHLALSLRDAGYAVWANGEASGTSSSFIRDLANDRMRAAGVQVVSLFSLFGELMRDWQNVPGSKELYPFLDEYYPIIGSIARGHKAAVLNGTILPGQDDLPI